MAHRTCASLALGLALAAGAGRTSAQILQKPVVTVSASQSTVAENPNAVTRTTSTTLSTTATVATFTFRIDQTLPVDFPIRYSVSGVAVNGKDYQSLPGVVTIRAGRSSASITISPIDDSEDEVDETVVVAVAVIWNSPARQGGQRTPP